MATEQRYGALDLATKPISTDSPTGEWIRYEAEFQSLKAEIDHLSGVDPNSIDWKQVVSLSSGLLGERSKDLLVACYLTAGLEELGGFRGLEEGLEALAKMTAAYWDGLYPEVKRGKARASAVAWLVERLSDSVDPERARPADREALEGCLIQVETLSTLLDDKLGGAAPALGPLKRRLQEAIREIEGPAAPPKENTAKKAEKRMMEKAESKAKGPSLAATPEISTPEEADLALARAFGPLKKIGRFLRQKNPQDPRGYQLSRIVAWLRMTELPRHTDGLTNLPPEGASPALIERYGGMAAEGDWPKLLEQAESQFERSVMWLDAQRFIALALSELGESYRGAHRVVLGELSNLIQRFPELQGLRFANDTPLASAETLVWIASDVLGAEADAAVLVPPVLPLAGQEDEELEQALEDAGKLARKKKLPQAVAALGGLVESAGSRRRSFSRRLALARFLADARQPRLALSQLEYLDEVVKRYRLEEWEPALALEVLRLFLGCQNQMISGEWKAIPQAAAQARELFSRLGRIDAAAAMGLQ